MFHLLNSIGFAHILPVSLALFSKIAPRQINATVIGLYYLAFFPANKIVGQVGQLYSTLPTPTFWLIHVASAAVGLVAFVDLQAGDRQKVRIRHDCSSRRIVQGPERAAPAVVQRWTGETGMPHERGLVWLTRLGFAARGLLYLIIAWLAIGTGRAEDLTGALEYLRGERALLMIILAGFLAYGFWRVTDAIFDSEGHGDGKKGALGRAGAGASGIIYLFLAWQAWRFLKGDGGDSGGGAQEQAGTVMELPGGTLLIEIGGIILFLAGLWQVKRAISGDFCKHLRARHPASGLGEMDGARRLWRSRRHIHRHGRLPDVRGPERRSQRGRRDAGRAALDGQPGESDRRGGPGPVRRLQPGRSAFPADQSAAGRPGGCLGHVTGLTFPSRTAKRLYGQGKL